MSLYTFITSNYILPTIEYTNQKIDFLNDDSQILYYESKDIIEFIIREYSSDNYCNVYLYTYKRFVYDLTISQKALPKLFNYLKENGLNKELEIWTVWLGDLNSNKNIKRKNIELINLNELNLKNSLEEASLFVRTTKNYNIDYKYKNYDDDEGQAYCINIKS